MKMKIFEPKTNKEIEVEKIEKSDEEWREVLSDEQYRVMRMKGTELPNSNTCEIPPSKSGIYECAACGTALFDFQTKFESGTGWPSFFEPISSLNIIESDKSSEGDNRIEVNCARCGSHLGHVFSDGPKPSGKRYCINAVALKLRK